jgi:hypothetical protein
LTLGIFHYQINEQIYPQKFIVAPLKIFPSHKSLSPLRQFSQWSALSLWHSLHFSRTVYNRINHISCIIFIWLLSLGVIILKFIYTIAWASILFLFFVECYSIVWRTFVLFLLTCLWTFGLFPVFSYYKKSSRFVCVQVLVWV